MSEVKHKEMKGLLILIVFLVILSAAIRYPYWREVNFYNYDASWHTLLTIEAYQETDSSQHLFLPIVTLGAYSDKWIPWGGAVPDSQGNYYYTSFSPAGYVVPYVFFNIFNLSVSMRSLYIFNTTLFAISAVLWVYLLALVYRQSAFKYCLCFVGAITYIMLPEVLHGMGVVYWHQSLMQVTLLLQIILYYLYLHSDSSNAKKYYCFFLILALINPYIEWTGYIANVGFALAELIRFREKGWKNALASATWLGILTILSFALFCVHYLLRVDAAAFFGALRGSFMGRNITASVSLTKLVYGYIRSFKFAVLLLAFFLLWGYTKNKHFSGENLLLLFVMVFPVLENIVMKQHAIFYSYDRMKAAFPLCLLICETARAVLEDGKNKRKNSIVVAVLALGVELLNLNNYCHDSGYIWETNYQNANRALVQAVSEQYPDAALTSNKDVRGYMNLLFGRGIHEWCMSAEQAVDIAIEYDAEYVAWIECDGYEHGYELQRITVYHCSGRKLAEYTVQDGTVMIEQFENVDADFEVGE